ncbi:pteridine reductase [Crenobacter sp. SG2305]|uniref:pteridine reductase n=1 Tax=Crenobacter oryzisoli TaxID=3056844 RepID=UPI0025AAAD45|nr:pteridine reductase [Crenobacter sp. SG2305]MDN0085147.1 pteridine reductase [Crenobacter sp. SG2305]
MHDKVVLITGAARRVGAGIARHLHEHGWRLALHCRGSRAEADALAEQLNAQRAGSTMVLQADLLDNERLPGLVDATVAAFGRLDALVNNASSFFPTEVGEVTEAAWHDLMGSNLKAPLFLAQAAAPYLAACGGAIVGIVDIHAERPMKSHLVYNLAKAGHAQLIRSLAIELAPKVRVNGVAPGSNVWPEGDSFFDSKLRMEIEASIPLQRTGTPDDIARTVRFLLDDAPYITGQIIAVDGGRSVVL